MDTPTRPVPTPVSPPSNPRPVPVLIPKIQVDIVGVGLTIAASVVCTMFAGISLGFIFGMNVQGCPWLYSRKVINDKCECSEEPDIRCTVRALISREDGARAWVDTKAKCAEEKGDK
jgi:hypothetical protein